MSETEQMATDQPSAFWHLDRRIPIALVVAVLIQTMAFTWGAATLNNTVKNNGDRITNLERKIEAQPSMLEGRMADALSAYKGALDIQISNLQMRVDDLQTRVRELERENYKIK